MGIKVFEVNMTVKFPAFCAHLHILSYMLTHFEYSSILNDTDVQPMCNPTTVKHRHVEEDIDGSVQSSSYFKADILDFNGIQNNNNIFHRCDNTPALLMEEHNYPSQNQYDILETLDDTLEVPEGTLEALEETFEAHDKPDSSTLEGPKQCTKATILKKCNQYASQEAQDEWYLLLLLLPKPQLVKATQLKAVRVKVLENPNALSKVKMMCIQKTIKACMNLYVTTWKATGNLLSTAKEFKAYWEQPLPQEKAVFKVRAKQMLTGNAVATGEGGEEEFAASDNKPYE
ncbi:hypothetical protein BDR04DRAFT_1117530 [Suillus decipiens]|nr:hypothetical protein BDR04DRAFT_1117530 [Suillus decipiens]